MIVMFLYALGFSVVLWKENSKAGAIAIFILGSGLLVAPFYFVFRQ